MGTKNSDKTSKYPGHDRQVMSGDPRTEIQSIVWCRRKRDDLLLNNNLQNETWQSRDIVRDRFSRDQNC